MICTNCGVFHQSRFSKSWSRIRIFLFSDLIWDIAHSSMCIYLIIMHMTLFAIKEVKVGFFSEGASKIFQFLKMPFMWIQNCSSLWIDPVIKSPHYEIWLKNANLMDESNCLQCLQSYEIIDYNMSTYLYQFQ